MFSVKAVKGSAVITVLPIITVLCPHSQAAAPQFPTIPPPLPITDQKWMYATSDKFSAEVLLIPVRSALLSWNLVKPRLGRLFFREKVYSTENLGNMTSNFLWSDHMTKHALLFNHSSSLMHYSV